MKEYVETRLDWQVRLFPLRVMYHPTSDWDAHGETCDGFRLKVLNRRGEDKGGVTFYSVEELEEFARLVENTLRSAHADRPRTAEFGLGVRHGA
jgi:hypothetical protein